MLCIYVTELQITLFTIPVSRVSSIHLASALNSHVG